MDKYLNDAGYMIQGLYKDNALADVADEDPAYLRTLLDEGHLDDDEEPEVEAVLAALD